MVFPLFTPEEEKKWAHGWDFKLLFPPNGTVQKNYIFQTLSHDHKQVEAIWIISDYLPDELTIEYQRIEPGIKIGNIVIKCEKKGANQTAASVTYIYTGLSEKGNRAIEKLTEETYRAYIAYWERAINHYLATGETLVEA